ncbi:MAG: flavin reductase family protein, partial [Traorella sp.]
MKEIKASELNENVIKMIKEDWMLIGAKNNDTYNMMTASWGMMGCLWNKEVINVYVRPTRYTYQFMENSDTFSCSFFDESYRQQLVLCGKKTGRDIDKAKECHFTTNFIENAPVFNEAKLTIICRKIAVYDLQPSQFIDKSIEN